VASHTAPTTQTNNNNNVINRLIVVDTPQSHTHTTTTTAIATTTTTTTSLPVPTNTYLHIGIPINMRLVTINTSLCLRKDAGDASKGGGFFFVNTGILVFRDDTMMMNIYKGEAFRTNGGYTSIPTCITNEPKNCCVD